MSKSTFNRIRIKDLAHLLDTRNLTDMNGTVNLSITPRNTLMERELVNAEQRCKIYVVGGKKTSKLVE